MAVTDLTHFTLKVANPPNLHDPPTDQSTADLRSKFAHFMRGFCAASGKHSAIMQDADDFSKIYLIGGWESAKALSSFSDSDKGKELYARLKDVATLEWIAAYDLDFIFGGAHSHLRQLVLTAPLLGVGRHNVAVQDVKAVEEMVKKARVRQDQFSGFKGGAGWKVYGYEAESGNTTGMEVDGRRELIVFSGWKSLQSRQDFPTSEHYMEFAKLREYVKWFDRKTLRLAEYDDKVSR